MLLAPALLRSGQLISEKVPERLLAVFHQKMSSYPLASVLSQGQAKLVDFPESVAGQAAV